jgi:acyl-CoA synthetase (NDP forming)
MGHVVDESAVERLLSGHQFAVVGASDDPKVFGPTVVIEFASHGCQVVAVNPNATEVAGAPFYPDIASVPGEPDCGPALTVGAGRSVSASRDRARFSVTRSDPHEKE